MACFYRGLYILVTSCGIFYRSCCIFALERSADELLPYRGQHGSIHKHRVIRALQPEVYKNRTYEEQTPALPVKGQLPVVHRPFVLSFSEYYWSTEYMSGHHIVVQSPEQTVSVLEPGASGGCERHSLSTVINTAQSRNCLVAVNAGFFNTTTGACLGDVVSDGDYVHDSGQVQNAHFGIKKDGSLFIGYIPDDMSVRDAFDQLVSGVIWLVRDGKNYIEHSMAAESESSQETGSLQYFVDVQSARLAIGYNKDGQVIIISVDGRTGERGVSLPLFAELLIDFGVVNAINLDGGGSTTVVVNGTLVNYPGDTCNISSHLYSCEREVSTVICVHDIPCGPQSCSGHGDCRHGDCVCTGYWSGRACETLLCGKSNCSAHGVCTEDGCRCNAGYVGADCDEHCAPGWYGPGCGQPCQCEHGELCEPSRGQCFCAAGYEGFRCQQRCSYGRYGEQCLGVCDCEGDCTCHPVTGQCDLVDRDSNIWQAGRCSADKIVVRRELLTMETEQYFLLLTLLVVMVTIAVGSIVLNVVLLSVCEVAKKSRRTAPSYAQVSAGSPDSSSVSDDEICDNAERICDNAERATNNEPATLVRKITGLSRKAVYSEQWLWKKWPSKKHRSRPNVNHREDRTTCISDTPKYAAAIGLRDESHIH